MKPTRRQILQKAAMATGLATGLSGGLAGGLGLSGALAQTDPRTGGAPGGTGRWPDEAAAHQASLKAHTDLMAVDGLKMHGDEDIVMLMYPGFTALDLIGPQFTFAAMMGARVHLVTTEDTLAPVATDTGVAVMPTMLMRDVPETVTVLFVPGGAGATARAMATDAIVDFLADTGARADLITSVCTGSLLLGMAGLLEGRRATSHWITRDILADLGAVPVDDRVVIDGNVITGAGVSAGLDMGLFVLAHLRGRPYGEAVQLQMEYDPAPPFDAGSEAKADPAIAASLRGMFAPVDLAARKAALRRRKAS